MGVRENDGGNQSNHGSLQTYMEIGQWNPPVQLTYANKKV
jgi:hypothetical protein